MKKYLLPLSFVLFATSVFGAGTTTAAHAIHSSWYKAPPSLPDMALTTTEGKKLNAQTLEGKVVLVLFQPDCDHCQRGAEAIRDHLDAFGEYDLYFITNAPIAEIQQFARDYQLSDEDNIYFAATELQPILDNFGSIPTPSTYIYSGQKKLVKAFEGETPIDEIIESL